MKVLITIVKLIKKLIPHIEVNFAYLTTKLLEKSNNGSS